MASREHAPALGDATGKKNYITRRIGVAFMLGTLAASAGCSVFHASVTQRYRAALAEAPYDAIIVPGYPSKKGKVNRVLQARVYWSQQLLDQGVARNIIYSGAAVHTPYVEGEFMALFARAIGVPETRIFTETNAFHSCENVFFSYRMARGLGFEKIAVASDPLQTRHLRKVAREFDLPVAFLPVDFVCLARAEKTKPKFDSSGAYVPGFVPLKERWSRDEIKRASSGARIRAMLSSPDGSLPDGPGLAP